MRSQPSEYATVAAHLCAQKAAGTKFGIDRMRVLTAALGHPEQTTPCIHIAGTNGKGSVAAMLESILRAAGWRTGLYTSPHLVHLGERVQVDRVPLSEGEIVAFMRELQPLADRIAADDPNLRPSFFEFMTAMAFLQFARRKCGVAIVEVGLGGRLDATNVVIPEISVITSIGLDHCEILGNQLVQIAAEKAGIVKPGVPVIVGRMPLEAEKIIRCVAAQRGSALVSVAEQFGPALDRLPATNLGGEYQRWNAATASLVARRLASRWRIDDAAICAGLAAVRWPGRWQRVELAGRTVILDASHNSEGAAVLEANLARLVAEQKRRPIVMVGALGAIRAEPLIAAICRYARELRLVVPSDSRACSYEELERCVPADFGGLVVRDNAGNAFPGPGECRVGQPGDTIIVTGSIYLVGEVFRRLGEPS